LCGLSNDEAFIALAGSARLTSLDLRRVWWKDLPQDQSPPAAPGADSDSESADSESDSESGDFDSYSDSYSDSESAEGPSPGLAAVLHCCSSLQRLYLQFWTDPWDQQRQQAYMPHSSLSAISSLMLLEDLTLCNLHVVETVSSFTSVFHPRPITNLPASLTRLRIAARETVSQHRMLTHCTSAPITYHRHCATSSG
jgi:hypothetical protein